ncbi:MAG: hypothetical protein ACK5Q5_13400, partial [Planctomycetaceae bacterium]
MMRSLGSAGLSLILLLISATIPAADWPQWRGPSHNGQAPAAPLQIDWPSDGPPVHWRAEVGTGFSSLAIADGRLFTIGNTADIDTISALHADSGELLW